MAYKFRLHKINYLLCAGICKWLVPVNIQNHIVCLRPTVVKILFGDYRLLFKFCNIVTGGGLMHV